MRALAVLMVALLVITASIARAAPKKPKIIEEAKDFVVHGISLLILVAISGAVGYIAYSLVTIVFNARRAVALLIGAIAVCAFWVGIVWLITVIEESYPALKPVTAFMKTVIDAALEELGLPKVFGS